MKLNMLQKLLFATCLAISFSSQASINLEDLFFNINDKVSLKKIRNSSDTQTEFVKVAISKMEKQPDGSYLEKKLDDPSKFIVSPQRFVIPPNGVAPFRIVQRPGDNLELYRVDFISVIPSLKDGFSEDEIKQQSKVKAGFNLSINLGAIAYVNPENKRYDTKVKEENGVVSIINKGNSVVKIDYLKECSSESKCDFIPASYVLPGTQLDIEKEHSVSFRTDEADEVRKYEF